MLTNYASNLFTTCDTLDEALLQVSEASKAMSHADSIAMRTAIHIVLNTAIQMHIKEMAAKHTKYVTEVSALEAQLAARPDPVSALLSLVDERVDQAVERCLALNDKVGEALDERMDAVFADKFDDAIDSWADDKLDDKIEAWNRDNVDVTDDVKRVLENEVELDDMVQKEVRNFFMYTTFGIEPR